ncbi:sulfatase-like hydrolase/transferase [Anaeromyxobacter paludicola]|nr:sulfatase-like hydrolase/transferase [Anaeromyxobacter paludicola]
MRAPLPADERRRACRHGLFALVVGNAILCLPHVVLFARAGGGELSSLALAFLHLALLGQMWGAVLALGLVLALLALAGPLWRAVPVAAPAAYTLLHAFLYIDRKVWAILHFHVNRFVLGVVFTSSGVKSLEIPWAEIAQFGGALTLLFALELAVYARGARAGGEEQAGAELRRWARLAAVAAAVLAADRAAYATANRVSRSDVTEAAEAVPYYRAEELRPLVKALRGGDPADGGLAWPARPLRFEPPKQKLNVLVILLESFRADAFDREVTPNMWRFAQEAQWYPRHRSGGNGTWFGAFSLFYGLHGAYAERFLAAHRGPLLFDRARELGYDTRVMAAQTLASPPLRDTVFANVPPSAIDDALPGAGPAERDEELARRARRFLSERDRSRPFLLTLFFDSTHMPYSFPAGADPYRPYPEKLVFRDLDEPQPRAPIWNRYRNAARWVDGRVGEVLDELARQGLGQDTVVLLVADHGEAFWEHGRFGHNSAFDREQTAVPLALRVPGLAPALHPETSRHVDVAPTLMSLLGCESPPRDWSHGRSLLALPPDLPQVACGFRGCAIVEPDGYTTFVPAEGGAAAAQVYAPDYRRIGDRRGRLAHLSPHVSETIAELGAFLR